jgi:hypothetical protein
MAETYNPFVRTFCQLRNGLMTSFGVARRDVRPETQLDELLPIEQRREAWEQLRRRRMHLPALELSRRDQLRNLFAVIRATISSALYLQRWQAVLVAFPAGLLATWASRHRAVHFPPCIKTVGEMVIYAIRFGEHKERGYRWTRNDISLKVRMIVAERAGLPLEEIQPETRLIDL